MTSMSSLQPLKGDSLVGITLVATDMDGTLTRQGQFTTQLLQALEDLANADIPVLIVTGRSAGWVSGLAHYLPVVGAIAENGGVFHQAGTCELLINIANLTEHRRQLAYIFQQLQAEFPQIRESIDNRFRLTDWTFDIGALTRADLQQMTSICQTQDWGFTYSTVQCHIFRPQQNKARGLCRVLGQFFPQVVPREVVTIGDSPNDESLFDPSLFAHSIGVANIQDYIGQMRYQPIYVTGSNEIEGFCEVAKNLIALSS